MLVGALPLAARRLSRLSRISLDSFSWLKLIGRRPRNDDGQRLAQRAGSHRQGDGRTQPFGIGPTGKRPGQCPIHPRTPALDRQGLPRCSQSGELPPLELLAVELGQVVPAAQAQAGGALQPLVLAVAWPWAFQPVSRLAGPWAWLVVVLVQAQVPALVEAWKLQALGFQPAQPAF